MAFKTQADLEEALRVGTVPAADAVVEGEVEDILLLPETDADVKALFEARLGAGHENLDDATFGADLPGENVGHPVALTSTVEVAEAAVELQAAEGNPDPEAEKIAGAIFAAVDTPVEAPVVAEAPVEPAVEPVLENDGLGKDSVVV